MFDFLQSAALAPDDFNEKTEFVLPGLLAKRMITMFFADGGNGKSWLALALAKYCAQQAYQVIYLDYDNPLSVLRERHVDKMLIEPHANLHYIQRSKSELGAADMLASLAARATAGAYQNTVVILDSLRNFGDVTHDAKIMTTMDQIMDLREAGATVVLLHHSNKDGRNYQGSNNIRNSIDNMYQLQKRELCQGVGVLLRVTKERASISDQAFDICPHTLNLNQVDLIQAQATEADLDFVQAIKQALTAHQTLNKTDLLNAAGFEKDDKTARDRLDKYQDVYWHCHKRNNRYSYQLLN